MEIRKLLVLGLACAGISLIGCACETDDTETANFEWPANTSDAVATYAQIAEANYLDSVTDGQALNDALKAFTAAPGETTLQAAKDAWLNSRESYLQTEVFRFYGGPIDDEETGPEGLLNAWPLNEAHIDYVVDEAGANDFTKGFINGTGEINPTTVEAENENGGEANVATGYHAIEFLLWGQDITAPSENKAGQRAFTDFTDEGDAEDVPNADRRSAYLTVVGDLLVQHLGMVHGAWTAEGSYRGGFEADSGAAFEKILTGMTILAGFETGGERLQAALTSGDQEEEHSCFSDNTHRDMIQDVQGIANVWNGSYGTIAGTGIKDVVAAADEALAATISTQIAECLAAGNAMQVPFDLAISTDNASGRAGVEALVTCLLTLEDQLESVFDAFALTVPVAE